MFRAFGRVYPRSAEFVIPPGSKLTAGMILFLPVFFCLIEKKCYFCDIVKMFYFSINGIFE